MRFGRQVDMAGIIAPSEDADRAVRYLTKYLTKAVADTHTDPDAGPDPAVEAHVDRLHAELRYLPCSERCANWLRYGIQPDRPARACSPAAARRRRTTANTSASAAAACWSPASGPGRRLAEHKADRATVVREALLAAGIVAPETERLAATVTLPDGSPRFVWTDTRPDARTYARVLLASIAERQKWREQYEAAKAAGPAVDNRPATGPPADPG